MLTFTNEARCGARILLNTTYSQTFLTQYILRLSKATWDFFFFFLPHFCHCCPRFWGIGYRVLGRLGLPEKASWERQELSQYLRKYPNTQARPDRWDRETKAGRREMVGIPGRTGDRPAEAGSNLFGSSRIARGSWSSLGARYKGIWCLSHWYYPFIKKHLGDQSPGLPYSRRPPAARKLRPGGVCHRLIVTLPCSGVAGYLCHTSPLRG